MRGWCLAACLACFVALVASPRRARAGAEPAFGLHVHVAPDASGADVRPRSWLDVEVALAERIFGPLGVHVAVSAWARLDARFARIEDVKERDALAPDVTRGEIHVFLVGALRDSEVKDMYRKGVTWDSRTAPPRRFIILSADATPSSLAHELGHFFGIQPHSTVKNNLMSYDRADDEVFLDASQQAIVRRTAAALRSSGALVVSLPSSPPAPPPR
jgi:hypothetical protein